ncbi:MAG: hypothetical protein ABJA57_13285, partial [Ginsengibacter sp.]
RPHAPQTCALPGCATSRKLLQTCAPLQRGYIPKTPSNVCPAPAGLHAENFTDVNPSEAGLHPEN